MIRVSRLTLLDGTTVLGNAGVDPKGNWSIAVGAPLATGQHSLTATEADPNGVASSASAALPLTILSKAVNDFDGDGKSDLLWRNTGSPDPNLLGTVSVWEAIAPDPQKPGFLQTTHAQRWGESNAKPEPLARRGRRDCVCAPTGRFPSRSGRSCTGREAAAKGPIPLKN